MGHLTLDEVVQAAEEFRPEERAALVTRIQATLHDREDQGLTRESIRAEFERRKAAGVFDHVKSMRNLYADPNVDISEEDSRTYLHNIGTEWEKD